MKKAFPKSELLVAELVTETETSQTENNTLVRWFLTLCDHLFGDVQKYEPLKRNAVLVYFGTVLLTGLLLILRRLDAITNPQFRVEDGTLLFKDSLFSGFWEQLTNLTDYANFPYLLPKLAARFVTPFGIANAPLFHNLAAIIFAALATAWFSLPYFRHIIHNDYLRILFCLLLICLPSENEEVVSTLIGVGLYLANWLFLVSIMQLPRSRLGLILLGVAFMVATFSIPYSLLVAPLWFVRLFRAILTHQRREFYFGLYTLSVLVSIVLVTSNLGANQGSPFSILAWFNVISSRVVSETVIGTNLLIHLNEQPGSPFIYLVTGGVLFLLLALSWSVRFRNLPVLMICAYGILSSTFVLLFARREWNQFAADLSSPYLFMAPRYFMLGAMLVYLAFFATLDRLQAGRPKLLISAALFIVIGFAIAQTFVIAPFEDLNWKYYAQQISTKITTGDNRLVMVPINPGGRWGWFIPVGTPIYSSEVKVDPQVRAGELTAGQEFSQTFVSHCSNMSGFGIYLSTYNRINIQSIVFLLKDLETGQVIVEREIGGSQLIDNAWHTYYFSPIENSAGHHYMFTLLSPLSSPGNAVTIWRSQEDAYPEGEAFINGQPLKADFVFRYNC